MGTTCTGNGPCQTTPLGPGPNWVTKADPIRGLGPYIRAIANALRRSGHSEQDAVRLAVGVVRDWAAGKGKVTPATRVRAAKALAEWEALRAAAHAKSHSLSRENAMQTIELASPMVARMLPDKEHVVAVSKKVRKWPEGPRKKATLKMIAKRAKELGMKPDGDGDFDYDVPGTAPVKLARRVLRAINLAQRHPDVAKMRDLEKQGKALPPAAGNTRPRYQIQDVDDLNRAILAVGRGKGSHDVVRKYIISRARALGASDRIPSNWAPDGSLKAAA